MVRLSVYEGKIRNTSQYEELAVTNQSLITEHTVYCLARLCGGGEGQPTHPLNHYTQRELRLHYLFQRYPFVYFHIVPD